MHANIKQAGLDTHIVVGTVLVSMYVRCGSLHDALQVFHRMPQRNVVSWTAMIAGCAQLGDPLGAFKLFACMKSSLSIVGLTTRVYCFLLCCIEF